MTGSRPDEPRFTIGIDVGGTFTDYVADDGTAVVKGKVPSRPGDEATSVLEALAALGAGAGMDLDRYLTSIDSIVLGTTVVLNTMLEFDGARTGLIANEGFRDVIELRRGHKESQVDLSLPAPTALIPRRLRRTVGGRLDFEGVEVEPLDESAVREQLAFLLEEGIESLAVCLLFSFVDPSHERRIAAIAAEMAPELVVSLSSDVLPQIREFERLSTTIVNAYTSPKLKSYLERLERRLRDEGFGGTLLVLQSNGGVMDVSYSKARGVDSVFSGPSGGVVAATRIAAASGYSNIITADMGGTSYDVCLVHDGEPQLGVDQWVGRYRVAVPLLDIHTVGAGGGSLAHVDDAQGLHVGPESARAFPGPACYGRGGERPTVTDANLVLGYIDPDRPLAGGLEVDEEAARRAIDTHVGRALGLSTEDAAVAIFRIANSDMANALRFISVSRGRDPRDYALVAFGGAGAIHASVQAAELNMATVLVPRSASVLSATGALMADFKVSLVQSLLVDWDNLDLDELNRRLLAMQGEAEGLLNAGDAPGEVTVMRHLDMRYAGQVQEVIVPVRSRTRRITPVNLTRTLRDFHDLHESLYAFKRPGFPTQVVSLRVDVIAARPRAAMTVSPFADESPAPAHIGRRRAYFEDGGFQSADIFDGTLLQPGNLIPGPAIIHEADTTLVVAAGQEAMLDQHDLYVIEISV